MWTEAHRARHEAGLKHVLSLQAVGQIAAWLERADPPRSGRATPSVAVVAAIWWHLRVGGPWRALPAGYPPWRTVYGWFRRWQEAGLFDVLLRRVARRRRRARGRTKGPRLAVVDTQSVKCIPVRGPRSYDAAKKVVGRKRVLLVDADGAVLAVAVVPADMQDRDCLEALSEGQGRMAEPARGGAGRRLHGRALPRLVPPAWDAPSRGRARARTARLRGARTALGRGALARRAHALGWDAPRPCGSARCIGCPHRLCCRHGGRPGHRQSDAAQNTEIVEALKQALRIRTIFFVRIRRLKSSFARIETTFSVQGFPGSLERIDR